MLGEQRAKPGLDGFHSLIGGQVPPFHRIALVVVKFLASIGIARIAVTGAAQTVVFESHGGQCRGVPSGVRLVKDRRKAAAIEAFFRRESAVFGQRGVKVDQIDDRSGMGRGAFAMGKMNDERHPVGLLSLIHI